MRLPSIRATAWWPTAARRACETDELGLTNIGLPEFIEACVRTGQPQRAAVALEQLSSRARAPGTEWALGLAARARALPSPGPATEPHDPGEMDRMDPFTPDIPYDWSLQHG
jgi:hypothetical protein